MKAKRLVNPGKKKRKLSPLQKLFFGSKRVRAAAKAAKSRKRVSNGGYPYLKAKKKRKPGWVVMSSHDTKPIRVTRKQSRTKKGKFSNPSLKRRVRRMNPSRILTVSIPGLENPGRKKGKKSMAKRRRRSSKKVVARRRRRVSNPFRARHTRRRTRRNPVVRYHRRKRVMHNRRRRRNPSRQQVMGSFGKIGGMFAGAAVTHIVNGFLPTTLTSGFLGYITTALVAITQGKMIGGVLKKPSLGNAMMQGGLFYLALKVVTDMVPSLGAYLPFSLSGMGLIGPSSFYVPQVNQNGSMGTFVRPSMVPAQYVPVAAGMRGIGGNAGFAPGRRTGRLH